MLKKLQIFKKLFSHWLAAIRFGIILKFFINGLVSFIYLWRMQYFYTNYLY